MPDNRPLISNDLWRSAKVFNLFRASIALALVVTSWWLQGKLLPDVYDRMALDWLSASYLALTVCYAFCLYQRWPAFRLLLSIQVAGDIAFIVAIMHIAGGLKSGIGLMLLPYLAAAGLVSRGRTTLFHAALATIALLLQQGVQILQGEGGLADFVQAGMLCIACFATAWLAYRLASYAT